MKKRCKHHGQLAPNHIRQYTRRPKNQPARIELRCILCERDYENNFRKPLRRALKEERAKNANTLGLPDIPQGLIEARIAQIKITSLLINNEKDLPICQNSK